MVSLMKFNLALIKKALPIVIMLNKQDEETKAVDKETLKEFLKLDQFKNSYKKIMIKLFFELTHLNFYNNNYFRETSGLTGLGIFECFDWLTNAVLIRENKANK